MDAHLRKAMRWSGRGCVHGCGRAPPRWPVAHDEWLSGVGVLKTEPIRRELLVLSLVRAEEQGCHGRWPTEAWQAVIAGGKEWAKRPKKVRCTRGRAARWASAAGLGGSSEPWELRRRGALETSRWAKGEAGWQINGLAGWVNGPVP
jgi:hypothetical protein